MSARGASPPRLRTLALAVVALLALAAPAAAQTLVRYGRSGGLAGVSVSVTVSTGGTVRLDDRRRPGVKPFKLSSARLSSLRKLLSAAEFPTLSRRYRPDGVVNDGFVETVSYNGRTVSVETGGRPPKRLTRLLSRLASFTDG